MKRLAVELVSTYTNHGMACEQNLAYTLTGEMRKHDNVPFDMGSDIPEFHMSVKSRKFTLVSGRLMKADTKEGQICEYFARTASEQFAYVAQNGTAYIMTADEFKMFLMEFTILTRDSEKNGGYAKVQAKSESKNMMAWLENHAN